MSKRTASGLKKSAFDQMVAVSGEQQAVADEILKTKSNVFVTGCAGVGKSVLLRHIYRRLSEKGIDVRAVAPTGAASFPLPRGSTYHRELGIGISKDKKEASEKAAKYKRAEIVKMHTLIFDEISMVSADMLDVIDFTLQHVRRKKGVPFGGVRMIFFGDFYQLPPIPEKGDEKPTEYAFASHAWRSVTRSFQLNEVHRQTDGAFIRFLNKVRIGVCDDEVVEFVASLTGCERHNTEVPVRICSRLFQVSGINDSELEKLPSAARSYTGTDFAATEALRSLLTSFPVEKDISLKVGAKVMAKKNDVDREIYNGLCGRVVALQEASVDVQFDGHDTVQSMTPEDFSVVSRRDEILAKRTAIPLKLAWASSAHTSQGQSLDLVEVDCEHIFEYGQIYVMLSRARTPAGLFVKNFSPVHVKADPRVNKFYEATFGDK